MNDYYDVVLKEYITNPDAYIMSNMIGFYNILEACRRYPVEHLVYASSSSVYGGNKKVPFSTDDRVDNPVSLYAATKKSNELFAHCYSKLYDIPTTGLRFFTVYGPAGRPDMAYFGFTNKLLKGETIQIFNYGNCRRDFTYVDDIVEGVYRVMQGAPERKKGEDGLPIPPYAVYNISGGQPENLLDFVNILQEELVRAGVLPTCLPGDRYLASGRYLRCQQTSTSRLTRSWFPCSLVMYQQHTQILRLCSAITASPPRSHCARACVSSRSGIRISIVNESLHYSRPFTGGTLNLPGDRSLAAPPSWHFQLSFISLAQRKRTKETSPTQGPSSR